MIEKLIEYSMRNRWMVILLTLGVTLYGVYSIRRTPVDAIPNLAENQIIVFADWMGRSAQEIEDQITYPLSVNLQGLAGVKAVRASSEFNFSMIELIFEDNVDFYFARTRVLERLSIASTFLPQGVTPYLAPDSTALDQIFWYYLAGDGYDLGQLTAIQDWYVRYQLNSVPGVSQVSTVGGMKKEYQVEIDPEKLRAYNVTLGQIYEAIQKSNLSVGGRVIHKNRAEYIIRSVGWIRSLDDIRQTVIVERNGVPIRVGDVAHVTLGPEFRRSVLEKDNREVVGGVVMMRYGENPLEVTKRIKNKLREIQNGLPPGVTVEPFYDRTPLIQGAIRTVTKTLVEEMVIACAVVLLIMGHFRSAVLVCLPLPLSVIISFILMRYFGVHSNIMSLAGIAISIGILVDQAVVVVDNATHHLTRRFGGAPVKGDTTEELIQPCCQVGRPIFFSVAIMVISFLPVFALSGQEGKLFHPLAFTKTFCLIAVALLSVTFIPALVPMLIRGRLRSELDNPIVRSFIEIYQPVLKWLMRWPRLVLLAFAALLGLGVYYARHLGREFMPALDEGHILDMPVTVARASVTEVADDLKMRDALIREFPEVALIVGKAGRADTPTDPSPLDMVESIITLRPREQWPKRKLRYDDAKQAVEWLAQELHAKGVIQSKFQERPEEKENIIASVTMTSLESFDSFMRRETQRRFVEFEGKLKDKAQQFLFSEILDQVDRNRAWARRPSPAEEQSLLQSVRMADFPAEPGIVAVERFVDRLAEKLAEDGFLESPQAVFQSRLTGWSRTWQAAKETIGLAEPDPIERFQRATHDYIAKEWKKYLGTLNWEIFDLGTAHFVREAIDRLRHEGQERGWWAKDRDLSPKEVTAYGERFAKRVYLWPKTKPDLLQELDTRVRMVGWANIWTQPIINRIDMLASGIRTQVGVKVFGKTPEQIDAVSRQVAEVLKRVPGAVDVAAEQNVGKGYVEIHIDREKAARYGVNVGDIQELIEVALGGKAITYTVEGRERFPIRIRYARDFRIDEESIKRLLVPAGERMPSPARSMAGEAGESASIASKPDEPVVAQVPLAELAEVKVVEGPVRIKSENGLLRSYVQLNVRDRDVVGFVEEARRIVDQQVKLPQGCYLEWAGQFEHQVRARRTLQWVFPAVLLLIFLILYHTYGDVGDAMLMMLAVPGALAGGVLFQTIFGFNFSVAVWVGYIACFGMATETGIIMLVYLRDAIDQRGGLAKIASVEELEDAVISGAVHRLRPKLLTEGTAILGLAPILWMTGVGAEVMRPMAAPILGGLLVADEVIDLFLPVLFYQLRLARWRKLRASTAGSGALADGASTGSPAKA